jgi:uncharacterized membrane protein YphA (DoxX/SURF4 family)
MKTILTNNRLELAVRWTLGLIFIYASFHKILSPEDFAKILYGYDLFPAVFINLIAILLPFIELVSGLALLIGIFPKSASLIITVMILAFIMAISINLIRGHEFDCGCFSAGESGYTASAWVALARDILFLAMGLQVCFFHGTRKGCLTRSGYRLRLI